MTVFVISSTSDEATPKVVEAVGYQIAEADRIQLNSGTWLVSYPGTATDVARKLGFKNGGIPGFVAEVSETAGRGPRALAKWIKENASEE